VLPRLRQQPVKEGRLMRQQALAMQGTPQVPVRGVQQSHRGSSSPGSPTLPALRTGVSADFPARGDDNGDNAVAGPASLAC